MFIFQLFVLFYLRIKLGLGTEWFIHIQGFLQFVNFDHMFCEGGSKGLALQQLITCHLQMLSMKWEDHGFLMSHLLHLSITTTIISII